MVDTVVEAKYGPGLSRDGIKENNHVALTIGGFLVESDHRRDHRKLFRPALVGDIEEHAREWILLILVGVREEFLGSKQRILERTRAVEHAVDREQIRYGAVRRRTENRNPAFAAMLVQTDLESENKGGVEQEAVARGQALQDGVNLFIDPKLERRNLRLSVFGARMVEGKSSLERHRFQSVAPILASFVHRLVID